MISYTDSDELWGQVSAFWRARLVAAIGLREYQKERKQMSRCFHAHYATPSLSRFEQTIQDRPFIEQRNQLANVPNMIA